MKIIHILSGKANPAITQNGVNVIVDRYADLQYKMGYDVEVWGIAKNPHTNIPDTEYPLRLFQQHTSVPRLLDKKLLEAVGTIDTKKTVIHFHGAFMPEFLRIASLLDTPIHFLMPHGLYSDNSLRQKRILKRFYLEMFERKLIRSSKGIIVTHKSEVGSLVVQYKKKVPFIIVPNGVDPYIRNIASYNETGNSFPDTTLWGYCGRIDNAHKAVDRIIRCFLKFTSTHQNKRHVLSIIGDGPDLSTLKKQYGPEIRSGSIQMHGKQFGEAKYSLLCKMDFFMHLSNYEGLPLSCLDALGLGIPLLVTNETNLGDDVIQYESGLVTSRDDLHILEAMEKLSTLDRHVLSDGCLRLAREKFDWSLSCQKLIKIYYDALSDLRKPID